MHIGEVACCFCGALCDDLEVEIENNRIVNVKNACKLGRMKFFNIQKNRLKKPKINGKEVEYEEAIKKVSEMLINAKKPLIYGFSSTSCEAQKVGVALAEKVKGVIDCTSSFCHGPSIIAMQEVGYPSLTLGEVKNRADLVIYWGSNPLTSHPMHLRRYSVFSEGKFRKGRKDRELIVVDVRRTETSKLADMFIQVKPNSDFMILNALRTLLNYGEINKEKIGGVDINVLKELIEKMKTCEFGILFFGLGLTMSLGKHRNVCEAISLVRDLNRHTKFSIMTMRGQYNVTGFNEVLTWQTGFPFAVDFTKGYPWYNPGETDANSLLQHEDVDAILVIASDPVAHFPKASLKYFMKLPIAIITPFENLTSKISDIVIPSSVAGIEEAGSAYRMDSVPLRLKKIVDPPDGILSDTEILKRILQLCST